ncbi:MAG: MBOAT family protein [Clostridia bacterium]|nr:MBOAT family protein [Clostridia bacterium]
MVFSSVVFLYIFLPIMLFVYFIVPKKFKNAVMIIASLIFFAWGEIRYIIIMLILAVMDYFCGQKINQYFDNKKKKRIFLWIDIGVNLLILFFFKYSDFIISNINLVTGFDIPLLNIPLPIGVSFNTFQSLSYIIDVYRGTVKCEKSFYNYLTYTTLFPQIIAGPIVRYETVDEELVDKKISMQNFTKGMKRFILGLGKKVLIANNVGKLWAIIESGEYITLSPSLAWIGLIAFGLQIYFDFSGYSDMAIGLANIFGMNFNENFNYPYISKSITEFWRRWHMTLSSWFKDYIYIPLGGNRKGLAIQIRNILVVWFLTGAWHGASWNFMLWGLYFGIILILEKLFLLKLLEKLPRIIRHIYSIFLILISWLIFAFEDLGKIGEYFKALFNFNFSVSYNTEGIYYLKNFALIIIIGIILSTPLITKLLRKMESKSKVIPSVITTCLYIAIFLCSTAYLVSDSFNPFLYFRF